MQNKKNPYFEKKIQEVLVRTNQTSFLCYDKGRIKKYASKNSSLPRERVYQAVA
jgi:hypothetical protein